MLYYSCSLATTIQLAGTSPERRLNARPLPLTPYTRLPPSKLPYFSWLVSSWLRLQLQGLESASYPSHPVAYLLLRSSVEFIPYVDHIDSSRFRSGTRICSRRPRAQRLKISCLARLKTCGYPTFTMDLQLRMVKGGFPHQITMSRSCYLQVRSLAARAHLGELGRGGSSISTRSYDSQTGGDASADRCQWE